MKVKEVFVAGGMPSITYVDRSNLSLEKRLNVEIGEGYKVICVTGPTKSGKTVLTRHVLQNEKPATINGGQVENSVEFWSQLLSELDLPDVEENSQSREFSSGLRWLISAQQKISDGETQTFSNNNKTLLRHLREFGIPIIVDDFHYMPQEVQREIIRSLKSEIFEGLVAVLIAVPHRAFDAIGVEREMEGRFAHIEIPAWSTPDLKRIAELGFPELNMNVPVKRQDEFAEESNGSPLLMQRFCARLCGHYDVDETLSDLRDFSLSDDVARELYTGVANQFGLPTFEKLAKGPQSRSKRIDRQTADGSGSLDIYQAVLRAVSLTGPKDKLHYNEIRDQLVEILSKDAMPQKHEVSAALGHMSGIARDEIDGEPVVEWADDFLYITDPFLMFYMRWAQRPKGGKADAR